MPGSSKPCMLQALSDPNPCFFQGKQVMMGKCFSQQVSASCEKLYIPIKIPKDRFQLFLQITDYLKRKSCFLGQPSANEKRKSWLSSPHPLLSRVAALLLLKPIPAASWSTLTQGCSLARSEGWVQVLSSLWGVRGPHKSTGHRVAKTPARSWMDAGGPLGARTDCAVSTTRAV